MNDRKRRAMIRSALLANGRVPRRDERDLPKKSMSQTFRSLIPVAGVVSNE